jgi:hypothetical protein
MSSKSDVATTSIVLCSRSSLSRSYISDSSLRKVIIVPIVDFPSVV